MPVQSERTQISKSGKSIPNKKSGTPAALSTPPLEKASRELWNDFPDCPAGFLSSRFGFVRDCFAGVDRLICDRLTHINGLVSHCLARVNRLVGDSLCAFLRFVGNSYRFIFDPTSRIGDGVTGCVQHVRRSIISAFMFFTSVRKTTMTIAATSLICTSTSKHKRALH